MTRKTKMGKIGAKVFATILSVALSFSSLSLSAPGAMAFAVESEAIVSEADVTGEEIMEADQETEGDVSSEEEIVDDASEADESSAEAGTSSSEETEIVSEDETALEEAAEADAGQDEAGKEVSSSTENEKEDAESGSDLFATGNPDEMVAYSKESSKKDGITTTTTKWDFGTAANTGYTTTSGDSIKGIIVGGASGRVILDSGKDLNVKNNNNTADNAGVIYLPIADDTNVVTITVAPIDSDASRYVTVGSFDSEVKLVDNKADDAGQTVTFKSELKDFVVNNAGTVEGRFIPLYSHGNFKVGSIELVETDAVTVVDVSGKLTGDGASSVKALSFKNESTDELITCDVTEASYSVSLANGFRYVVSVSGSLAYAIDSKDDGNILDLTTGNDKEKTRDFAVVDQDVVDISGAFKIEKLESANPVSATTLKAELVPAKKTLDKLELKLTKGVDDYNYTFEASVLPGEEYSVKLTGANDYECTDVKLKGDTDTEKNDKIKVDASETDMTIEVSAKPLYDVELEAVTHNLEAVSTVTGLEIKNLDDDYTYSFKDLTGSTLKIKARDGLYEVTGVTVTGSYEPYEHFEVEGENVKEKMYLKDTSEKGNVSYASEISVGGDGADYTTIYDALDAVKRMDRSDDQRVTIVLNDEYYQEQVVVDVPNVTFKSTREGGTTISWYYGLGGDAYYSAYYNESIDKHHLFYDEAHAVDQYESRTVGQTPGNWGSTVNLKSTATGFRAENITFENSFNFYISDAEKADIAVSGAALDRKAAGADPKTYKAKERACTMYNRGADKIEFYNCNFISSQDTIYTGDADEYSYFYDCTIEGTTDFICGDGDAVFDNCSLVLNGFSDKEATDLVIVASKGMATKGYLFNYCTIGTDRRDGITPAKSAYLGRPWGTDAEKVAFMNTILESDLILEKGWTTMNTVPSLNKDLHEYGTRLANGTKVDLSGRVAANIGTDKQGTAANYVLSSDEGYSREDYLSKDWTPSYFGADYAEVNEQVVRYNAFVADAEAYAKASDEQKKAVSDAYKAIETGLFASDQAKVDAFAANLEAALDDILGKVAKAPVSDPKSGTYTGSCDITLTTETEGAKIYYTVDGSEPTAESTLYEKAIVLTKSATVKAIAVAEGYNNSEVSVFDFVIEAEDTGDKIEKTYVFDATTLTAGADQEAIADGSTFADSYYTSKGTVSKRINKDTGAVTSAEIGKAETGYFEFNVSGTANVTVVASSTGSKNESQIALVKVAGESKEKIANEEKIDIVSTTTKTTLTYNNLGEGTYRLVSPEDATRNRGTRVYTITTTESIPVVETEYLFDATTLTAGADQEAIADGSTFADSYYTSKGTVSKRINKDTGAVTSAEIGKAETGYFEFNVSGTANVTVVASSTGSKNESQIALVKVAGESKEKIANEEKIDIVSTTTKTTLTYYNLGEGTYRLVSPEDATRNRGARVYTIKTVQKSGGEVKERKAWSEVADPVVGAATVSEDGSTISVEYTMETGYDGADSVSATMFDATNDEKVMEASKVDGKVATFVPTRTGKYYFVISADRKDEETKYSEKSEVADFVLPLATPEFKNAVNVGKGSVKVNFYSVPEATSYVLTATDKTDETKNPVEVKITKPVVDNKSTEYTYTFKDTKVLTVGHTYELSLVAVRTVNKDDEFSKANTLGIEVIKDAETEWVFSAFGQGVSSGSNCGYTKNEDGSVTVWNTGNKGKLVPASTDGLAFYYTAVPAAKNFTLTAKVHIDGWTFTNGQEGFGLMAADRVGVNGDSSVFWNNSYMASGTKVEYNYDPEAKEVTNVEAEKITMKLGLGAQEKTGVTLANLAKLEANDTDTVKSDFSSKMYPLELSCAEKGTGTYNLFGNDGGTAAGTVANPITDLTLRIRKNNTGYFVSYLDDEGNELGIKKFYDTKALQKLDSKYVYVGFFAARTFKATFSDYSLTLIDPSKDDKAEDKPVEYVKHDYKVVSASWSNSEKYDLKYTGNADGVLTIADEKGNALVDSAKIKSGALQTVPVRLAKGVNRFFVTFTPNKTFRPGGDQYKRLDSYDTVTFEFDVEYGTLNPDAEKIYVAPKGDEDGKGTEDDPVDIYTAVKYVQPGQTISLAAGTYSLNETVIVERGIDGTASRPISMVAEDGRAVLDFNDKCAGVIFVGNYWHVKGIDVTKSGNSQKGIQVSGSHITLEDVRTYFNGNTGIQISRYLSSDKREDWPSYDLILNCTSYGNADAGYEDADGFAAKLTCGDGIVFDGCISYNNADDGWDLFAKVESGSIGNVTIQNCVAFSNGYGVDGKSEGNGNGFKMGGSSMAGAHKLINSVAWGNKAKGIDSNSGPDIQVYRSMSFNNGSNNVALYTNDTANTNYIVEGVLSYRTDNKTVNENIKPRGTQDESRIYGVKNFFWNDGESSNVEGIKPQDNWFVSFDAPKADNDDPYAVAGSLRAEDGRIDLGNFMRLSDTGVAELTAAGIDPAEVVATLGGSYEAVTDESAIDGSENDASQRITGFTINGFDRELTYTGKALKQNFIVYYGDTELREGVDYTVAYKNNTNVGMATVTVTGKGNYTGKTVETFTILPEDISKAAAVVKSVNETGKEAQGKYPAVTATVTFGGKTLKAKTDYTLEVNWNAEPVVQKETDAKGNEFEVKLYPVTITATPDTDKRLANFYGTKASEMVKVYPKGKKAVTENTLTTIKNGTVEIAQTAFEFNGSAFEPQVTVYTGKGTKKGEPVDASKYTVKYASNINKGTATITVSGIEAEGYTGTLTKKFTIAAAAMDKAIVAVPESAEYTKGGVKPVVTVTFAGETLREGVDYKLTYAYNNKAGVTGKSAPKVTVTGLKNFKGSVVKYFVITQKDINTTNVITTDKAVKKTAKGYVNVLSKPAVYDVNGKALTEKTDYTLTYYYNGQEINAKSAIAEDNALIEVRITGTKEYMGETSATYSIRTLKKLSTAKNDKIADQKYTGKEVRPDGSIKLYTTTGSGKSLTKTYLEKGVDFDVVLCFNNVKQGTAVYLLKGKGEFSGYKTVTFKITKAKIK